MIFSNYLYLFILGLFTTTWLWICSAILSLAVGSVWGSLRARQLRVAYISASIDGITFVLRAIPFYVQLLLVYFVVPYALGFSLSALNASIISLGLCSAGYVSQMIKAGIDAVGVGQWEAAYILGYTRINTMRYLIFPQAFRIILPALIAECDQLLKSTAVVSAIGVLELTGVAKNIVAQEMNPLTMYSMLALVYLTLSALLALASRYAERSLA